MHEWMHAWMDDMGSFKLLHAESCIGHGCEVWNLKYHCLEVCSQAALANRLTQMVHDCPGGWHLCLLMLNILCITACNIVQIHVLQTSLQAAVKMTAEHNTYEHASAWHKAIFCDCELCIPDRELPPWPHPCSWHLQKGPTSASRPASPYHELIRPRTKIKSVMYNVGSTLSFIRGHVAMRPLCTDSCNNC